MAIVFRQSSCGRVITDRDWPTEFDVTLDVLPLSSNTVRYDSQRLSITVANGHAEYAELRSEPLPGSRRRRFVLLRSEWRPVEPAGSDAVAP